MKVLFAASECVPFVKTGGLADVVGTLPAALAASGIDVRVILPKYKEISEQWKNQMQHLLYFYVNLGWRRQYCGIEMLEKDGVTYYFVDNEFYFARDSIYGSGNEEGERFAFFCRAVLESLVHTGFVPDVIHCNDWQTGMIPALLATQYRENEVYKNIKTIYTIHNLRYQGIFSWMHIDDLLGISEQYFKPELLEYYGCISFMKGGIVFSDYVTTVSPTYAQEIQTAYYGERLDGLLRSRSGVLTGILNGIDPSEYDPASDPVIPAHYSVRSLRGKAECKRALQEEMGLDQRPEAPVIGIITRLTEQKGIDLIECVIDDIMRQDVQVVMLGKGEQRYHDLFGWASWRYQGRFATRIELNQNLSHRIYAGADLFLMPSKFEPCGLSQMIAMRYGTLPVVRETGGLKDSVQPYNKYTDEGTGFSFANYNAHEMLYTIEHAVELYKDRPTWERMMKRAMKADFSWEVSAKKYAELYWKLTGGAQALEEKKAQATAETAETEKAASEPKKTAPRKPAAKKSGAGKIAKTEKTEKAASQAPKKRTRKPAAPKEEGEKPAQKPRAPRAAKTAETNPADNGPEKAE